MEKCGVADHAAPINRITGGDPVGRNEYPWHVSLNLSDLIHVIHIKNII